MGMLIENHHIQIAHTERRDLPFVVEAERAQGNAEYVGQWSTKQHEHALDDLDILHLMIKNADGQSVGYVIIKGIMGQNDSIELMRIVVADKGAGYGKSAIGLIKKWCFEIQHAHRLWLDVRAHNLRAQHVYETQGFLREGVLRECVKVGNSYQSLVVMSILSQDYYAGAMDSTRTNTE